MCLYRGDSAGLWHDPSPLWIRFSLLLGGGQVDTGVCKQPYWKRLWVGTRPITGKHDKGMNQSLAGKLPSAKQRIFYGVKVWGSLALQLGASGTSHLLSVGP